MPASPSRSRRPAGQTRAAMLEVAVDRVKAEGLRLDLANIELEDLIRIAEVPRSTVFRIWPDRAAFVTDLIRALFEADPGFDAGFDVRTLELLTGAIDDPSAGAGGREAALREVVRRTVAHNVVAVDGSMAYRAYRTMTAALAGGDAVPGGDDIRALLVEIEHRYVERMAAMYGALNQALGIRMRSGVDERDLAVAVMGAIDGLADHRRIAPAAFDAPRLVALCGAEPAEWHVAALAVYGVYTAFTEPSAAV